MAARGKEGLRDAPIPRRIVRGKSRRGERAQPQGLCSVCLICFHRPAVRRPAASPHICRLSQTDHCFPASASDHFVCCVDIQNVDNSYNQHDSMVARCAAF